MAWFVAYTLRKKGDRTTDADRDPLNVILRKTHPVIWAANPPPAAKKVGQVTYLLFFQEIPDEIAEMKQNWCNVED